MADFSSMFGGAPQQGGMFGGQQQSPLMQLLGMGGQQQPAMDQNQLMQLAQRLMQMGNPTATPQGMGQMMGAMGGGIPPGQQPNQLMQMLMQRRPGGMF